MITNKWLKWTVSILVSLAALGAVGISAYRVGVVQGAGILQAADGVNADSQFAFFMPMHGFDNDSGRQAHAQMYANHMNGSGKFGKGHHGYGGFFPPIFGLFHLALLGLIGWLGYKWIKNSGWQVVRVTPKAEVAAPVDEKK